MLWRGFKDQTKNSQQAEADTNQIKAVFEGNEELCSMAVSRGARVDACLPVKLKGIAVSTSALMMARSLGHVDLTRVLIRAGAAVRMNA